MSNVSNENERIYIIVPEKVQNEISVIGGVREENPQIKTITQKMEPGRLMAQCAHAARKLQNLVDEHGGDYRDITTIVLSVRNSKELTKVTNDLYTAWRLMENQPEFTTFEDSNPLFYGTDAKVQTAVIIGPVENSQVLDDIIGHLELYS
jgi:peptidyl-tRNA hydrolase